MNISQALLILMLLGSNQSVAVGQVPVKSVVAVVKMAVDGDTVTVCKKGLDIFEECVPVRIRNINTPEKHLCKTSDISQCEICQAGVDQGIAATQRAREILKPGDRVKLGLYYRDLHGRIVADLKTSTGADYATQMITEGFAAPYDFLANSTRPRPWCK